MIVRIQSLADRIRRTFGLVGEEAAGFKQELAQRSGAALLRRKRTKVAMLAVLFGVVSSVIELPLPLEDLYRAGRAELRSRPAPRDVVMIAIDDKTRAANNYNLPNRLQDTKVVDTLIASGVRRVVFDRAHADPETPKSDAMFADMLARHKGRV
jgi:diguanylate cyclase